MPARSALLENLKMADMLKEKSLEFDNINNIEVWTNQSKLLNIYEQVLLEDLELALEKQVEHHLWNYCFKNYIASLQTSHKGGRSSKLSWLLESASGFYTSLLQQICTLFSLDLPFKRCDRIFGMMEDTESEERRKYINQPSKTSLYYICQYCLVHLGDIARYSNQTVQAHSFYKQAIGVGAWSGQPYNQLALLGVCLSDRLSTVYYYVRSLAVSHPFHNALPNLTNTLNKALNYKPSEEVSLSCSEYESLFIKLIACLHCNETQHMDTLLQSLATCLTPLIATQHVSSWKLIQICAISIWMWEGQCVGREPPTCSSTSNVKQIISEYISSLMTSLLLPVYTISSDSLLSYTPLPAIKILLSWMDCQPSCIDVVSRVTLWRALCKLLNQLRIANPTPPPHNMLDALPEDEDLRGFLPLASVLDPLNYDRDEMKEGLERKLRAFRIIKLAESLSTTSKYISIRDGVFEAVTPVCDPMSSQGLCNDASSSTSSSSSGRQVSGTRAKRHNVALESIMRLSKSSPGQETREGWRGVSDDPTWYPPSSGTGEGTPSWIPSQTTSQEGRMYSLFSGEGGSSVTPHQSLLKHQSLWSGPGPSPLERLLQQQKNQRNQPSPDT